MLCWQNKQMEYPEDDKMSRQDRYSANLQKTEDNLNWKHNATSERNTPQGSSLLRRKALKSNLTKPKDHWRETKRTTLQKSARIKITETNLNWNSWGVTKLSTTRNASLHHQHLMTIWNETCSSCKDKLLYCFAFHGLTTLGTTVNTPFVIHDTFLK